MFRVAMLVLAALGLPAACKSTEGPDLGLASPEGPGSVVAHGPSEFESVVLLGEALDFSALASANHPHEVAFSVAHVGGTLTPQEAGFNEAFPLELAGEGQLVLEAGGEAAQSGTIILEAQASTGSDSASWTLEIRIKHGPVLEAPAGPGEVHGEDGVYETALAPGEPLEASFFASTPEQAEPLALSVEVVGGTLTPQEAGFVTSFPAEANDVDAVTLPLDGVAASVSGTIELAATVEDSAHADGWLLTVRISTPPVLAPPTAPGSVTGDDGIYETGVAIGDPLDLIVSASDDDASDTLTLTVNALEQTGLLTPSEAGFTSALPAEDTGTSPISLALDGSAQQGGTVKLEAHVTDGTHEASWQLTIHINTPPVLAPPLGPGQVTGSAGAYESRVTLGEPLDFDVIATDADTNDTLTITTEVIGGSLSASEVGFTQSFPVIDSGPPSLVQSLSGVADESGTIELRATVSDGLDTDSYTLEIAINAPPELDAPTGPGTVTSAPLGYETTLRFGDSLDFSVTATDPDANDTLELTAEVVGGTLSASQAGFTTSMPAQTQGTSPVTLDLEGSAADYGTIELRLRVSDGVASDEYRLTIRINTPPSLDPPAGPGTISGSAPQFEALLHQGEPLDVTFSATDPDAGDVVTVSAEVTGGSLSAAQAGFATALPVQRSGFSPSTLVLNGTAAEFGTLELTVTADDGLDTDQFVLTIHINEPPVLGVPTGPGSVGGTDHQYANVETNDSLDFTIEATDPDPNDTLALSVEVTGGTFTAADAGFTTSFPATNSGTSPVSVSVEGVAGQLSGTVEFTLHVEDSYGLTDTKLFTIAVHGYAEPVIANRPATLAGIDMEWSWTPQALGNPTPTVTTSSLPGWMSFDGTTLSGTPSAADIPSSGTITVTASNGIGNDYTVTFEIVIGEWEVIDPGYDYESIWLSGPNDVYVTTSQGVLLHYDGNDWDESQTGLSLTAVSGSASDNVFLPANETIRHYDGTSWSDLNWGSENPRAIWVESQSNAVVVGNSGAVRQYDGNTWTDIGPHNQMPVRAISGSSSNDLYVVSNSGVGHYDGSSWGTIYDPSNSSLLDIWVASPTEIFAVGSNGYLYHYDGNTWHEDNLGSDQWHGVWGTSATDVYAVGYNGSIAHFDGTAWSSMTSGSDAWLRDVWGSGPNDVYATGGSAILHYDGTAWSEWRGAALMEDVFDVDGISGNDLYIAGSDVAHWDGNGWTVTPSPSTDLITHVWHATTNDLFVTTPDEAMHHDGTQWNTIHQELTLWLRGIWGTSPTNAYIYQSRWSTHEIQHYDGTSTSKDHDLGRRPNDMWGASANDIFVACQDGQVGHYDGTSWSTWSATTTGLSEDLVGIWGTSGNDVYFVGDNALLAHYDGSTFSTIDVPTSANLTDIDGRSGSDIYAVGAAATLLRYDGTFWSEAELPLVHTPHIRAVWVDPTGSDMILVGANGMVLRFSQ